MPFLLSFGVSCSISFALWTSFPAFLAFSKNSFASLSPECSELCLMRIEAPSIPFFHLSSISAPSSSSRSAASNACSSWIMLCLFFFIRMEGISSSKMCCSVKAILSPSSNSKNSASSIFLPITVTLLFGNGLMLTLGCEASCFISVRKVHICALIPSPDRWIKHPSSEPTTISSASPSAPSCPFSPPRGNTIFLFKNGSLCRFAIFGQSFADMPLRFALLSRSSMACRCSSS
mmetsp:Transcript_100386/g.265145  ORF Transcript_100386/g.265145 Transcript_100386/m.265145 type:complete len:233 (+) Transcript_100386:512-1210(+)